MLGYGVWDLETGENISRCKLECLVATMSFAWSHDSQRVAIGSGRHMCFEGSLYCVEDFNIRVWSVETSLTPLILEGHRDDIISLTWHPDGNHLTSVSLDDTTRIWDIQNNILLQPFYIGTISNYGQAIISPDGGKVAVIDYQNAVRVFNLTVAV
jgi:WD40 repeat protein